MAQLFSISEGVQGGTYDKYLIELHPILAKHPHGARQTQIDIVRNWVAVVWSRSTMSNEPPCRPYTCRRIHHVEAYESHNDTFSHTLNIFAIRQDYSQNTQTPYHSHRANGGHAYLQLPIHLIAVFVFRTCDSVVVASTWNSTANYSCHFHSDGRKCTGKWLICSNPVIVQEVITLLAVGVLETIIFKSMTLITGALVRHNVPEDNRCNARGSRDTRRWDWFEVVPLYARMYRCACTLSFWEMDSKQVMWNMHVGSMDHKNIKLFHEGSDIRMIVSLSLKSDDIASGVS